MASCQYGNGVPLTVITFVSQGTFEPSSFRVDSKPLPARVSIDPLTAKDITALANGSNDRQAQRRVRQWIGSADTKELVLVAA